MLYYNRWQMKQLTKTTKQQARMQASNYIKGFGMQVLITTKLVAGPRI